MKKAMVYGGGISGLKALELLKVNGYETILVDDKKAMTKEEALLNLKGIEVFVKSPGIPYNELTDKVKELGIELIDEIELAFRYDESKAKIIAITGTNGKTTTTSKIKGLLEVGGFEVEAGGNIGKPYAEIVLEGRKLDYIVLELSSYQLENLKNFRAYISLIINLSPDHLARYESVEAYYRSKLTINNNQNSEDYYIYNKDSFELSNLKHKFGGKIVEVSSFEKDCDFYVKSKYIYHKDKRIAEVEKMSLKGKHNLENIMFIIAVGSICGVEVEKMQAYLYTTESLEHRMEFFLERDGSVFINDSKGTNIDSTIKAIEAYSKKPILICGGKDKLVDLKPLCKVISRSCKALYLIGETANTIEKLTRDFGFDNIYNFGSIDKVVENIEVVEGDIVLFSPAHSSFDQFENYIERGNIFKELILKKYT